MSLWFHQLYPQAKVYLNEKDPALYKLFKCMQEEYEEFREWLEVIDSDYRAQKGAQSKKAYYYSSRNEDYNPTQYLPDEKVSHEKWCRSYFKDLSEEQMQMLISKGGGDRDMTKEEIEDLHGKNTPLEHAFYFFLRKLSFSGMNVRNKKGEYASAPGIRSPEQPVYDPERLEAFKAMLDHAELFNTDYRQLDIQRPKSLHYFDPPYVDSIHNLFTSRFGWDETEALCEYGQRLAEQHTVFMSNYDHPRLKKLLKGFDWYTFPAVGGMQRNKRKEPVREILFYKIHPSIAG
jgi:site-specific DNA-adenine methylase